MSWRPVKTGWRSFSSTITLRLASTNAGSASTEREGMMRPFSSIDVASTTATSTGFPSVKRPCRTRSGYSPIRQSKNSTDPSFTPLRAISLRYGKRRRTPRRAMLRSKRFVVAPPVRSVSSYLRPASADRARASGISFARDEPPMQEKAIEPRSGTNRSTASSGPMTRARRAFDRIRSNFIDRSGAVTTPLAITVLLRPIGPSGDGEVRPAERVQIEQLAGGPLPRDAPLLQHVPVVRDPEGLVRVLLDREDREARLSQPADRLEDFRDDLRGESEARLIEDEDLRARHQRSADRDHLLLASAEPERLHVRPGSDSGEQLVDLPEPFFRVRARAGRVRPQP